MERWTSTTLMDTDAVLRMERRTDDIIDDKFNVHPYRALAVPHVELKDPVAGRVLTRLAVEDVGGFSLAVSG